LGGGMADVYRARDSELPRDVAIKILKPSNEDDPEVRASFLDEVQLASRCSHENIVSTYDKGEFEGRPFIVMEFLRGERLDKLIRSGEQGDLKNVLNIALQIARAIEYVHSQNIVHRDLKPQNLHVDQYGRVKLVDFGIAKSVEWNKTQAGLVKGTAHYMAPEQILGNAISFRTDIWAFGIVLFEMLSGGKRPFQGATLDTLWAAIINGTPDYQVLTSARVPEAVQQIVKRCLEKQAEKRFQSFAEVCEALQLLVAPERTAALAPSPAAATRSRTPLAIALAAALLLALGVTFFLLNRTSSHNVENPPPPPAPTVVQPVVANLPPTIETDTGEMVLVDGGEAVIGMGQDAKSVNVPSFYIDKTEVTNAAYLAFCQAAGHAAPGGARSAPADHPVVNVSFEDAQAYAQWAKKRLPTAAEWEKAARGPKGQLFPWGNKWQQGDANIPPDKDARKTAHLFPALSFTSVGSPCGAVNMIGNAWEWVNAPAIPDEKQFNLVVNSHTYHVDTPLSRTAPFYQLRGGSFRFVPEKGKEADLIIDSFKMPPSATGPDLGFRCAKDP